MVKNYIALEGFTGTDISVYKHQVIKMDEGKAAQLVADGKLAEYYNSCAIPKHDLTKMGAIVGQTVNADTKSLYNDLIRGITKCTLDFNGIKLDWNVLAIKIEQGQDLVAEFSGVFMFNREPAFVQVAVTDGVTSAGKITIHMIQLEKSAS